MGRPKKIQEEAVQNSEFNEFGVCVACQGGVTECLHNNLAESQQGIICVTCGKCMSCHSA